MKNGILKITAFFLLLLAGGFAPAHAQVEWFPIGATWYYQFGNAGWNERLLPTLTVEKDTVIDGRNARVVRSAETEDIVYENDGRVYYYFQGKFRKIFDFNVNVGDTVEFEFRTVNRNVSEWNLDTTIVLPMLIEEVSTRIIDGMELREISAYYVYEGVNSAWAFHHFYIEKIGVEFSSIQHGIFPVAPGWVIKPEDDTRLRCYRDNNIEHIADWWARRGLPCDYNPHSSIRQPETNQDIVLHPNPVQNVLTISAKTEILQEVNISIHDATGKVVFEKNAHLPFELNVEHLQSGIYFVRIFDESTKRLTSNKFIKK